MKTDEITLTPEDPAKVKGPEVGTLCLHHSNYTNYDNKVVTVLARSYVWSPERQNLDGTYGWRRYDWSVVDFGTFHLVVDDVDLEPIVTGMTLKKVAE